jgi:23S rRNA pseudouridine1911/1915/1917 synthase
MARTHSFTAGGADAGLRLDEFLAARLGGLSRMRIASHIAGGACRLNGAAAHAGLKLRAGDRVEIELDDGPPGAMTPEPVPLDILHEDDSLLVLVKPAGMLVHPTRGVKTGTLANALAHHLNGFSIFDFRFSIENSYGSRASDSDSKGKLSSNSEPGTRNTGLPKIENRKSKIENLTRPGFPHRLDRATSGLMVVAKTQRALSVLSRHFHERRVEKRYLAVVRGRVAEDALTISAPIGRDEGARPQWGVVDGGRPAETRLRVLERRGPLTLVELEPVTGRTNQLRIHCAHVGHAIFGDELYGPPADVAATRLCLHASHLAFNHPAGGRRLSFTSPLPEEIKETMK